VRPYPKQQIKAKRAGYVVQVILSSKPSTDKDKRKKERKEGGREGGREGGKKEGRRLLNGNTWSALR
jgi:hypothetical protein